MSADHRRKTGGLGIQIERIWVVNEVEKDAAQLNHFCLREPSRPWLGVHIAANRRYRCDLLQFANNLQCPNIARVNDVFRPTQQLHRFRTKQPMRIRDDTYDHGRLPAFSEFFSVPPWWDFRCPLQSSPS